MTAVSRLHVLAAAVAGALAILVLSACVASAGPNAIPAGTLVVTRAAASRPVASGFVGLSMEYRGLAAYAGTDPRAIDPPFLNLVRGDRPRSAAGAADRRGQHRLDLVAGTGDAPSGRSQARSHAAVDGGDASRSPALSALA